jgi:hypothetical protein
MRLLGHSDVGGRHGGNSHKEPLDSLLRHPLSDSATECDGLEDHPTARNFGIAIHPAPGLHGRADEKLQVQASSGVVSRGSHSKRHPHFFKELLPLRLRKANDQPGETRQ